MKISIKLLLRLLTTLMVLFSITSATAAEMSIPLDRANNDLTDKASLQRGMTLFTNYCLACHQMQYQRYNRVAKDLDIPEKVMLENLIFDKNHKIGDLMTNAISPENATAFFGKPAPDLTLETKIRGADWVYTYLRSFYVDPTGRFGVNNVLIPGVAMPNVLELLQGAQTQKFIPKVVNVGKENQSIENELVGFENNGKGSMSPSEYDVAVQDLVNFLEYSAEPIQLERKRVGLWVLAYLFILLICTYLLKKAFWRDVKSTEKNFLEKR